MFSNCLTPADVKSLYRTLALKNHPDLGGNTRDMQDINACYLIALRALDGYTAPKNAKGYTWTYHYNEPREQSVMAKVHELLALSLPSDVSVWIVGVWVWVRGTVITDQPTRNKLSKAKLRWHSTKKSWYWKPYAGKTRHSGLSFGTLAAYYGAKKFEVDDDTKKSKPLAIPA